MDGPYLDRFRLERHPPSTDPTLRAWQSADAYLIRWLAGGRSGGPDFPDPPALDPDRPLPVIGDRFGALTVPLAAGVVPGVAWVEVISDSALALEAVRLALDANAVDGSRVLETPDPEWPRTSGAGGALPPSGEVTTPDATDVSAGAADSSPGATDRPTPGALLLKVPKAVDHLVDLLIRARAVLPEGAPVLAAGMSRHIHTSTVRAFEEVIGPTATSHAWRKSRLVHATIDAARPLPERPLPRWSACGIQVVSHPAVFSAGRLDGGTGLLLRLLELEDGAPPQVGPLAGADPARIADLGCGTGLLGVAAGRAWPDSSVHFADDSFGAIATAARTARRALGERRELTFRAGDALAGVPDGELDLILVNPPFHAQGARGDDTAFRMFVDARRALRPGGRLYAVGNRHLGYHVTLARVFGNAEVVGSDRRFVVVEARRD